MMGDEAAAQKSYETFLDLWKNADPDIPIYQQAKAEYADHEKSSQARLGDLKGQLVKVQQSIKAVENSLPADVRPAYERLVAARGEDAMAAVQNRTCMACYTEITAQAFNDLMLSQFVLCKSCGRVLYLPE